MNVVPYRNYLQDVCNIVYIKGVRHLVKIMSAMAQEILSMGV